ncbi:MAG: hypothetical protein HZB26_24285 [Candidatus Hydrogenedentes bacterium]|nr:hypothetical protein [Candidatus Hydrogenedentota bacterium]
MRSIEYRLKLSGLHAPEGKIGVRALLDILGGLTTCAERQLRLVIEGSSVRSGRNPAWLGKAVDLTFSGIGKGSTTLTFEAPILEDVMGEAMRQEDFWVQRPAPDDTALSLFAKSIRDATTENLESEYYDGGVLSAILDLKPFVKSEAQSIELISKARPADDMILGMEQMEKAEKLKIRLPEPGTFLVSGKLDAIEHSRRRFHLLLAEGHSIHGQIDEHEISPERLRDFWGRNVTVKGTVFFKPSGHIKLLEAQHIRERAEGEEVFEALPAVQTEAEFVGSIVQAAEKRNWVKSVWGKWPGDETIEETIEELKR